MSNDVGEVENELRSVLAEKRQVLEQIETLEQQIHDNEIWLKRNRPTRRGYQEIQQELDALKAYVGELFAQVMALNDILLDLRWERMCWDDPDLLLAS